MPICAIGYKNKKGYKKKILQAGKYVKKYTENNSLAHSTDSLESAIGIDSYLKVLHLHFLALFVQNIALKITIKIYAFSKLTLISNFNFQRRIFV